MKNIILKPIGLLSLFMILTLSLFAWDLTDGKGLFKSNKLLEKVLIEDKKVKIHKVEIEGFDNIFIKVLTDLENDITFFKYKDDIVSFRGEIIISDILSNKKNNNLYIFSQSIASDLSYYDVTLMNNKGLKILGSCEAPNIYEDINFQKLEEIYSGIDYIFKSRNGVKYLYSTLSKKYIKNKMNQKEISSVQVKNYFKNFERYGNSYGEKHFSQKEIKKVKTSNKSYQAYQELNKYDILDSLIKDSNYLHLLEYYTSDLEYWGAIDYHTTNKNTLFMLVRTARKMSKNGKQIFSTMPLEGVDYNPLNNQFTDGSNNILPLKYPNVWSKIFNIYYLNKPREYLFIKEKSYLYKKPNSKSKSKKFLIKNDCALILDKTSNGWYKVFYYHPRLHTNTIMWIKFDDKGTPKP